MNKMLAHLRHATSTGLFWIQERLYCTEREAIIFVSLVALIFFAHGMRILRANISPFDDAFYASTDSLFNALSARADSLDAVDTLFTGPSYAGFQNGKSLAEAYAEVELYVIVDTLDKPVVQFPININTASSTMLQALPRIGPQMANRILESRKSNPFTTIEDLKNVRGIGDKTFEKMSNLIVTQDSTSLGHED